MELLRIPEAARQMGVSVPTLKQWIYAGKIRSVTTAGGHHRIPRAEIDRLLFQKGPRRTRRPEAAGRGSKRSLAANARIQGGSASAGAGLEHIISGRNQLVGRIKSLRTLGLLTKVTLDVGGQTITSIITRDACRDLELRVGETAAALIKSTEVMIIRPVSRRS